MSYPAMTCRVVHGISAIANCRFFTVVFAICALFVSCPIHAQTIPSADLKLWLKTDAGVRLSGNHVRQWDDLSGSGNHASQTDSNRQPIFLQNAVNGQPAVAFNGTTDFLSFRLSPSGSSGMTIILVSRAAMDGGSAQESVHRAAVGWGQSATGGGLYISPLQGKVQYRFGTAQPSDSQVYTRPVPAGSAPTMTVLVKDESQEFLYIDRALRAIANGLPSSIDNVNDIGNLGRGQNAGDYFDGEISELLVYTRALSDAERLAIEEYLSAKYAIATTPQNSPAFTVRAGNDQTIAGRVAALRGMIDRRANAVAGLPTWSQVSGPGKAKFADRNALDTSVEFPEAGTYRLRLSADSTDLTVSEDMEVEVANPRLLQISPSVSAPSSGPLAYWKFDERSGTAAADASGKGNTAVLQNGTGWSTGKIGAGALMMDGTDDRGIINTASFDGAGDMTITAWVNTVANDWCNYILDMLNYQTHVWFGVEQRDERRLCF